MSTTKRPDELLELLRKAFDELRLPEMAAQLDATMAEGREDEHRLAWLWRVVEPQLTRRREGAVERRIRAAKFPSRKSLDNFDFDFQPGLDRQRVLDLATLEFVQRGQNLLLAGMSGTGKSHICIAIGYLACAAGFRVRYTTSADMLADLHASLASDSLFKVAKTYIKPQLLIIDEVGLDRPERDKGRDAQLFYKIIRQRHQAARSVVITSNIKWEDWGEYLGDDIATVAILDRLVEHGYLLTIKGPSWRGALHKQLNAEHGGGDAGVTDAGQKTQDKPVGA